MTEQEKADLLSEVKSYLHITWDEENPEIQKMIDRAISYFKSIVGQDVDFIEDGQNRQLLLDRCRYVRNHAVEEFEENFGSEIRNLQFRYYVIEDDTAESL